MIRINAKTPCKLPAHGRKMRGEGGIKKRDSPKSPHWRRGAFRTVCIYPIYLMAGGSRLVEITLDALLGGLGKLAVVEANLLQAAIAGQLGIELRAVLLHDHRHFFLRKGYLLHIVGVRIDEGYEVFAILQYEAFAYDWHGVQLVLNLLGVDVLPVGTEQHVFDAPLDEEMAIRGERAEVARMEPSL